MVSARRAALPRRTTHQLGFEFITTNNSGNNNNDGDEIQNSLSIYLTLPLVI